MEKRYYNIREISEYLGISASTIYHYIGRREIPYYKIRGNVRFDVQQIEKWLKIFRREVVA